MPRNLQNIERLLEKSGFSAVESSEPWIMVGGSCVKCIIRDVTPTKRVDRVYFSMDLKVRSSGNSPYRAGAAVLDYPPAVALRIEGSADQLAKKYRLSVEHETGDESFDDRVYVESDASPDALRAVLGSPKFREEALRLLENRIDVVAIREYGNLTGVCESGLSGLQAEDVHEIVHGLARAWAELPTFAGVKPQQVGPDRYQAIGLVMVFLAVFGGVLLAISVRSPGDVLGLLSLSTVGVWLGMNVVLAAIAWRVASGSSVGLRRFGLLVVPGALFSAALVLLVSRWM